MAHMLSLNGKTRGAAADLAASTSGFAASAQKCSPAEACHYDSDTTSVSDFADEADWPDTDGEDEEKCVKSLELKRSGRMEHMLAALQSGNADPRGIVLLLRGKVTLFAMNKVGCKALELLVPQLDEAQMLGLIRELEENVVELAAHRYGSRVLRAVLAAQRDQPMLSSTMKLFLSELLVDFDDIILNPFACRVFTDLLMLGDEDVQSSLAAALLKHDNSFFILCLQEFACHVIARAVRRCPKRFVFEMARQALAKQNLKMTRFPEGLVVLRALLEDAEVGQKIKARLETRPDLLAASRGGRRLMTDFAIREASL